MGVVEMGDLRNCLQWMNIQFVKNKRKKTIGTIFLLLNGIHGVFTTMFLRLRLVDD
jgi:hypothetical protein